MSKVDPGSGIRPSLGGNKRHSASGDSTNGRARVPSAANLNDAELDPSDSASNAPSRRTTAASQRTAVRTQSYDRTTEKAQVTTRHSVQIRTRSPTKMQGNNADAENIRRKETAKPADRTRVPEAHAAGKDSTPARTLLANRGGGPEG